MSVLVIVCSLLLRRRRAQKARRRRLWVHPCWRYRDVEGQANALLPRLRARDEGFFRDFLRMPPSSFDTLLHIVRPVIERQDTPFRRSISAHDRLAMTVRTALEIRDRLASYFMSDGQVPWQESVVTRAGRQEM
ncbi:uncharacterized protein LOC144108585 [Amblyomma americanum]